MGIIASSVNLLQTEYETIPAKDNWDTWQGDVDAWAGGHIV
jgi:hypothetical protein